MILSRERCGRQFFSSFIFLHFHFLIPEWKEHSKIESNFFIDEHDVTLQRHWWIENADKTSPASLAHHQLYSSMSLDGVCVCARSTVSTVIFNGSGLASKYDANDFHETRLKFIPQIRISMIMYNVIVRFAGGPSTNCYVVSRCCKYLYQAQAPCTTSNR